MTHSELLMKTGIQRHWLKTPQLLFFAFVIILLSVSNFYISSIEIKRPAILLVCSLFTLFNFSDNRLATISKITLLYIIEMFFNQISEKVFHVGTFSIHLSLMVLVPLAISFVLYKFKKTNTIFTATTDILLSWGIIFIVIILHMLFLFVLLKIIYGYGYDHNFAILANICLYFLVFIFSWQQLENIGLRRITSLIFTIFFLVKTIKGF